MGNDCVFVSEVKKKSALNDSRTASNVINNIDKIDLLQNHYITPDVDKSSLCTSDSNIIIDHSDVEPINKIGKELKKRFEPKKKSTFPLAASYSRIGEDKRAERVLNCGTFLEYARSINSEKCAFI